MDYPETPRIETTYDYDKFNFIKFNRKINKCNFDKLKVETKKDFKMHLFPVTVDIDYNIIDGQHRFMVCKEIGAPIYFIKTNSRAVGIEDIRSVNTAGRNHNLTDKIEMHVKANTPGIGRLVEVFNRYDGFFSMANIFRLSHELESSGRSSYAIDRQDFTMKRMDDAIDLLDAIYEWDITKQKKQKIIFPMAYVTRVNGVKPKDLIERLSKTDFDIYKNSTRATMVPSMVDKYNYGKKVGRISVKPNLCL